MSFVEKAVARLKKADNGKPGSRAPEVLVKEVHTYDADAPADAGEPSGSLVSVDRDAPAITTPAADHVSLTPAVGDKQWLLFRLDDRDAKAAGNPEDHLQSVGVHAVELTYDKRVAPTCGSLQRPIAT